MPVQERLEFAHSGHQEIIVAFRDVMLHAISSRQHTWRPIQQVYIKHLKHVRFFYFYTIPLQDNRSRIKGSIPGLKLEQVKGVKEKILQ